MGANIGTSVTNTIVSVTQINVRSEFRRAFAGATIHDMFNWLSVLCLLPMEWITGEFGSWKDCGLICQITKAITDHLKMSDNKTKQHELLKALTKPLTKLIIQLDKNVGIGSQSINLKIDFIKLKLINDIFYLIISIIIWIYIRF